MALAACLALAARLPVLAARLLAGGGGGREGQRSHDQGRLARARLARGGRSDHDHSARGPGELEDAIAAYPVVRALHVEADFPHRLDIRVIEHRPPRRLVGGRPGGGRRHDPARPSGARAGLPSWTCAGSSTATACRIRRVSAPPTWRAGRRLRCGDASSESPSARRRARGRAARRPGADLRQRHTGARQVDRRPRVLADPEAAGASYIDVRLPVGRRRAACPPRRWLPSPRRECDLAAPMGTAPTRRRGRSGHRTACAGPHDRRRHGARTRGPALHAGRSDTDPTSARSH